MQEGRYEVLVAYPPNANRSSRVSVEVHSADGTKTVQIDERKAPSPGEHFHSLGEFEFDADHPAAVVVTNAGANGYVVIDAVQWLPK